jgi:hypothetical protein
LILNFRFKLDVVEIVGVGVVALKRDCLKDQYKLKKNPKYSQQATNLSKVFKKREKTQKLISSSH